MIRRRIHPVGRLAALLLACAGCATYEPGQQPGTTAGLQDKFAQAEWRIVLFRWPPDYHEVTDGVTNKSHHVFIPYIQGQDSDDNLHTELPRDADRSQP